MPSDGAAAPDLIDSFAGDYEWLSNFFRHPQPYDGMWYRTAEAAFQAGKTLDPDLRLAIAQADSPGKAKALGRALALRPGWDRHWRHIVMAGVLEAKFTFSAELNQRLLDTDDALLIEGNTHCDNDWGCCQCPRHRAHPGHNYLGLALMDLRGRLRPRPPGHWPRVMCTGHRPGSIPDGARGWVVDELNRVAAKLAAEHGTQVAISGLAIGADLWWAHAAHRAGLRVWGYSPCEDQDARWTDDWKAQRRKITGLAARVATLSPHFALAALHKRNTWMLRDSNAVVAVVDPRRTSGGTVDALRKAHGRLPVIKLDVRNRAVTFRAPDPATQTAPLS